MRKYTLLISIAVHVVALVTIIVAPLLAAVTLPGVHASIRWVPVKVEPPPPALGDSRPQRASPPRQLAEAVVPPVPTQAPPTIEPEVPTSVPNLPIGLERPGPSGVGAPDGQFGGDPTGIGMVGPPPPPPPPPKPEPPPAPLRVGTGVTAPTKLHHVAPIYPPVALAAGREGTVVLEAVIGEDGRVRDLRVLRPVALLDQAAIDAVRQWRFTPTLLNGQPVPVIMSVTVGFHLK
jgi:protein TonB